MNVNLSSPCTLYYYNPEARSLAEIYEWNGEIVAAIKVLKPQLLKDLKPTYSMSTNTLS
ncbi:MAG: hypothetical protein IKJ65_12580 [Clostridia bacterium]|nr:hypothetical protein [Clostridia bacterium]